MQNLAFVVSQIVLEAEAEAEVQALKGEAEAYAIEVKAKVGFFWVFMFGLYYHYVIEVKAKVDPFLGLFKGVLFAYCRPRQSRWPRRLMLGRSTRRRPSLI